jgi:hypothetical protein
VVWASEMRSLRGSKPLRILNLQRADERPILPWVDNCGDDYMGGVQKMYMMIKRFPRASPWESLRQIP